MTTSIKANKAKLSIRPKPPGKPLSEALGRVAQNGARSQQPPQTDVKRLLVIDEEQGRVVLYEVLSCREFDLRTFTGSKKGNGLRPSSLFFYLKLGYRLARHIVGDTLEIAANAEQPGGNHES